MSARRRAFRGARILIIVQNLPVPLDRRVWLECRALAAAGYAVSVICPKGPGDPRYHEISGVRIYKYSPPPAAGGVLGYLFEFVYCWLRTAALSALVWLRDGIDVVQACNPPDTYWALARLYRIVGVKFVYDQHDLNPEVFRSRFGEPTKPFAKLQLRFLLWLERMTFRSADHVISTNESYRRKAIERGGVDPHRTTVVRSGPNTARMRPVDGVPELRCGREHLIVYLGIMGPQDGVDLVVRAMDVIVNTWHRNDIHAALLGFGDSLGELVRLTGERRLGDHITFTGRVGPSEIAQYLSTATLGVSPDPLSPLNDVSTMNKTMEYLSFALPVVSFDLAETRISGGDAVCYLPAVADVDAEVVDEFAAAIVKLIEDPRRREDMALAGRRRAETLLDWEPQRAAYVSVFDRLTGHVSPAPVTEVVESDLAVQLGRPLVDLTDDQVVRAFGRTRQLAAVAAEMADSDRASEPVTLFGSRIVDVDAVRRASVVATGRPRP